MKSAEYKKATQWVAVASVYLHNLTPQAPLSRLLPGALSATGTELDLVGRPSSCALSECDSSVHSLNRDDYGMPALLGSVKEVR
ncbi:unnamed protein product [Heligmosomoides polygyrus]|uniref:Uncharacterized protein n=1 Tax=Heligmosomoides polygyrus TaxID=6339 RepID=A0A183GV83_HELPZ|nr:unnamed protein product [Heligmosomoides polygyrus]